MTLSLEDACVPVLTPEAPRRENTIGIDMGLKSFLVDDSGKEVAIPHHYRKSEKRLKRLQRSLSRKKKGSNRRKKAIKRVPKVHLKVSNQSNCGCSLDRDHNAARNIKYTAVGHSVLKAHLTSEAIAGVDEKPALYA